MIRSWIAVVMLFIVAVLYPLIASPFCGPLFTGDPSETTGLAAEMEVKGNNREIVDGDTSPSTTDYTNFSAVPITGRSLTRPFYIHNTGTGDLTLNGVPYVAITGTHSADFTVTLQPSSPVVGDSQTLFSIKFDPSAIGTRSATVSIDNSDADESPYDFAIQGTGTDVPVVVTGAATNIDANSANLAGEVTCTSCVITLKGVAYAEAPQEVDITDSLVYAGSGTGSYNPEVTGLSTGTTYNYRAWARITVGSTNYVYYGDTEEFTTD